jgi:hypothetical protein
MFAARPYLVVVCFDCLARVALPLTVAFFGVGKEWSGGAGFGWRLCGFLLFMFAPLNHIMFLFTSFVSFEHATQQKH